MVEVVIPWRGGCPHRERALEWVRGRLPYPVTVAEPPTGPWAKALAVMPAASRCSGADVLVIHDADVWTPGLEEAVEQVERGAMWAIPHRGVHRLTEDSTRRLIAGESWEGLPLAERAYLGVEGGGVVAIHRDLLLRTPMDPRFEGWGSEDEAWAVALRACFGPPWRGKAPLAHLWHPPQSRLSRARGSRESWNLRRRYMRAAREPREMKTLLEEARAALDAAQPNLHDQPPAAVRGD